MESGWQQSQRGGQTKRGPPSPAQPQLSSVLILGGRHPLNHLPRADEKDQ